MEEGEDKSTKEGIMFIESSAKAGFNIKALFRKLATALPGMEANTQPAQPSSNRKTLESDCFPFLHLHLFSSDRHKARSSEESSCRNGFCWILCVLMMCVPRTEEGKGDGIHLSF